MLDDMASDDTEVLKRADAATNPALAKVIMVVNFKYSMDNENGFDLSLLGVGYAPFRRFVRCLFY